MALPPNVLVAASPTSANFIGQMAKIYISSTFKDLIAEREAAAKAVRRLGHQAIAMEDYVASDERPVDKCLADVRTCQAYVGIIAWRYGSIPTGYDKGITHLEYEEAGKCRIPRLIFVLDDTAPWPHDKMHRDDDAKIKAFREYLLNEHHVGLFSNRNELDAFVTAAVSRKLETAGKPEIPRLLSYMSDRSEQEIELEYALKYHRENKSRRPFLCFIHGDENECHDMFLERLKLISLPKLLKLEPECISIKDYLLQWPARSVPPQNRLNVLRSNLAAVLVGDGTASALEMHVAISRHAMPVMIHATLYAEDWQHAGPELVIGLVDFWKAWPDLAPGQLIFVFLCTKYKNPSALKFWKKRKLKKLNRAIRAFLVELQFSAQEKIHGTVLPELGAISQREVEDWLHLHARAFCHIDELFPKIGALYAQNTTDGGIHMQPLAMALNRLLNEHRC